MIYCVPIEQTVWPFYTSHHIRCLSALNIVKPRTSAFRGGQGQGILVGTLGLELEDQQRGNDWARFTRFHRISLFWDVLRYASSKLSKMLGEPHLRENVFMAYLDQATLRLQTTGEKKGLSRQVKTSMRIVAHIQEWGRAWEKHAWTVILNRFNMLWPSVCWLFSVSWLDGLAAWQLGVFFWLAQASFVFDCGWSLTASLHHIIFLYTLLWVNAQGLARPFKIELRPCSGTCVERNNLLITWIVVLGVLTLNLRLSYIMSFYR